MADDTTPVDIAPFDLLSQKEQHAHLSRFHTNLWRASLTTKTSKADMQRIHDEAHLGQSQVGTKEPHTHTAVPQGKADVDLTKGGILNSTQRKALKDLVDNDFLALKAEINQFANDMAQQAREKVRAEWAKKGANKEAFMGRASDLIRKYRDDADRLILEARTKGVELKIPSVDRYSSGIDASVAGLKEAIDAAVAVVEADRKRALTTLERQRLTAQRTVLMSGVNQDALAILDTIPDAKTLMVEAARERTNMQGITA